MDMTRDKIEAEILKWDCRRAEAVRLHNACAHNEPEMREILWRWVKVYEGFIESLRECLAVHIANPSHHAEPRLGGDSVDGVVGSLNQKGEE